MLKRSFVLFLIFGFLLLSVPASATATDTSYGYSQRVAVMEEDWGGATLYLQVILPDSSVVVYTATASLVINGQTISDVWEMDATIARNSFAKFVHADEETVSRIDFSATGQSYTGCTYATATKKFSGLNSETADLPVYYCSGTNFLAPVLDEQHTYDITVYPYGICITKMQALSSAGTIDAIEPFCAPNPAFLLDLMVDFAVTAEDSNLKAELYSATGTLLQEKSIDYVEETDTVIFDRLPNTATTYIIKAWLVKGDGTTSSVYQKTYTTEPLPLVWATVTKTGVVPSGWNGEEELVFELTSSAGDIYEPICARKVFIDGTPYFKTAIDQIKELLPIGSAMQVMLTAAGEIAVVKTLPFMPRITDIQYQNNTLTASVWIAGDTDCNSAGTVFGGIYDSKGYLKTLATGTAALSTTNPDAIVTLTIENYTYQAGDTLKVFFWDGNHNPNCPATSQVLPAIN